LEHSIFYPHPSPQWRATSDTGPAGNFFKGGDEILNPLDANFKGVDNKNLGCWNLPSMRGVDKKKWNIPL